MASIYKKARDRNKKEKPYYFDYTDHHGKRRTKRGFTDKGETKRLASKLEDEALKRQSGLINLEEEKIAGHRRLPIMQHTEVFERTLSSGSNTKKHIGLSMSRLRKIIDGCGISSIADLETETVETFLTNFVEQEGIGHRTYNHYVQAIDAFGRWLVATKRTSVNPVAGLKRLNTEVDNRHKRRALTPEEFGKLVDSARSSGKSIQCYDGETRARIYILSYMTGLRRAEIASLKPHSFDLNGEPATLTIDAACSKHRKTDVLPLHPELVQMLNEWLIDLPVNEPLFPMLEKRRTWLMVKRDLERVGISYKTEEGIADFHAAGRHTHITQLLRSGVTLPEARELARHSDVRMTMRYTHIGLKDQSKAIKRLPCQWIGSVSGVTHGQSESVAVTEAESKDESQSELTHSSNSLSVNKKTSMTQCVMEGEKWRRRELNPRPVNPQLKPLRAYFIV